MTVHELIGIHGLFKILEGRCRCWRLTVWIVEERKRAEGVAFDFFHLGISMKKGGVELGTDVSQ